jgi:hypothetical protein
MARQITWYWVALSDFEVCVVAPFACSASYDCPPDSCSASSLVGSWEDSTDPDSREVC